VVKLLFWVGIMVRVTVRVRMPLFAVGHLKLSPFKASGPDDIPNRLLKELSTELAPAMTAFFNQSLQTGQLPQEWKLTNVSPIYKKEDKHIAANCRPISLTCICSKLLEHIVVSQFTSSEAQRQTAFHSIATWLSRKSFNRQSTTTHCNRPGQIPR